MDIEIRHAVPDDYHAIHIVYNQPKAYAGTLQLPNTSPEVWRKRLEKTTENSITLVACANDKVVGSVGLFVLTRVRRRHVGNIGMGVHDDWQNKGVGKQLLSRALDLADNWYNLRRLELTVFVDNTTAVGLYKKAGFHIEGTLKQYAFRDGDYVDAYAMGRIKVT